MVKNLPVGAGNSGDIGSFPGSGRSPGGGNGNPLQHSCLENPVDRGAWWAAAHGVSESEMTKQTRINSVCISIPVSQFTPPLGVFSTHSPHGGPRRRDVTGNARVPATEQCGLADVALGPLTSLPPTFPSAFLCSVS